MHIIAVPPDEDGLRRVFRYVHRHYTGHANARLRTTGHLRQGRFIPVAIDAAHPVAALRYGALNPVRAKLVKRANEWQWSSSRALCGAKDNGIVTVAPALGRVGDFAALPDEAFDEAFPYAATRKAERIGRPVGSLQWIEDMEAKTGRTLKPQKRGPRPQNIEGLLHLSP